VVALAAVVVVVVVLVVVVVVVVVVVAAAAVVVVVVSVTCIKGHRFPTGQRLLTAHCSQDGSWQFIDNCEGTSRLLSKHSTVRCSNSDQ